MILTEGIRKVEPLRGEWQDGELIPRREQGIGERNPEKGTVSLFD